MYTHSRGTPHTRRRRTRGGFVAAAAFTVAMITSSSVGAMVCLAVESISSRCSCRTVPGGIVVVRYGADTLSTIAAVKEKLKELRAGLPEDVEISVAYDRTALIEQVLASRFALREAIDAARISAAEGNTTHTLGQVVHNEGVNAKLRDEGVVPVRELDEVAEGSSVVIRAHGVTPEVMAAANERAIATRCCWPPES